MNICSYLRGLELMQVPKPVKEELGGGTREFTVKDVSLLTPIKTDGNSQ